MRPKPIKPLKTNQTIQLQTVKRVSLELGGNAPLIVFEDADLDLAAKAAVASALRNSGQTCICANRVFVHDKVGFVFLLFFFRNLVVRFLGVVVLGLCYVLLFALHTTPL